MTFRATPGLAILAAFCFFVGPGGSWGQPTTPLAAAVNNGAGGVFALNPGLIYTGPVNFVAATTVEGNGATLRVSGFELIQSLGGTTTLRNLVIEHAGGTVGTFGFRSTTPAIVHLENVTVRGFSHGLHFLGGVHAGSTIRGCSFANNSDTHILLAAGGNILVENCTFDVVSLAISSEASSPILRNNIFRAPLDATPRTGLLARVNSYSGAGANAEIRGNTFENLEIAIHLAGLPGEIIAPRIVDNQFNYTGTGNGVVFIRSRDAEPLIEENAFLGGQTALEVTGGDSYGSPGFSPSERPFRANSLTNLRGSLVLNLQQRAPSVLDNTFINTDTAIYLSAVTTSTLVEGNFLQSLGLDESNINQVQPIGPAITVDQGSKAQVINNHIDGFVGGIQVVNNSQAELRGNFVTRCFFGGILIESGSSAWLVDNVAFRNRSDNFFVRNAVGAFIKNESIEAGQFAGNDGGASGFGFSGVATIPVFIGNYSSRSKDPAVSVIESSVMGEALAQTVDVRRETDPIPSNTGFFVHGDSQAYSVSGAHLSNGGELFSNTFAGPSQIQFYGNAFFRSGAINFAANINSGSGTVALAHNAFEQINGTAVGLAQGSTVMFERNLMGASVAPSPAACLVTGGNSRFLMRGNRFAALSGLGLTSGDGGQSESTGDWWGDPSGPNPPGSGLLVQRTTVTAPLAAPEGLMLADGPMTLFPGQFRAGSFAQAGISYEIIPGRFVDAQTLFFSRFTGLASNIPAPAGLVPGAIYSVVLPYSAWREGSGKVRFAIDPALVPAPFGIADAHLARYESIPNAWVPVPSRVEGNAIVFEWGGNDTFPPCGLFAIAAQAPANRVSAWRAENHFLGLTPIDSAEASAAASRNADVRLDVGDMIALVNAGR
jgi:hypothetical protein